MTDMINPAHYRGNRKFEPIEVIEDWQLNYRLGNAVKYISRNGRKPGEDPREGLRKAIWYIEREIASHERTGPYSVSYNDVLEDYAACAAEGIDRIYEYGLGGYNLDDHRLGDDGPVGSGGTDTLFGNDTFTTFGAAQEVPFDASEDVLSFDDTAGSITLGGEEDWEDFWKDFDADWDPTLGPVELTEDEIKTILSKKDLKQFEECEIVSTFDRRGLIIGVKKDGSTCVLNNQGRCS